MTEEYREQDVSEEGVSLAHQLGSSEKILLKQQVDMRQLTVLENRNKTPDTLKPLLFWLTYDDIVNKGKTFAESITDNAMHLYVSTGGGRGRRQVIQAEQVRKGGAVSFRSEIEEPGFFAKNIWNRNWEEKEKERLGLE